MDSLSSMNKALAYIEENLTEDIDFDKLCKIAYCSEYHFKRMFSFLSGISLSEYIRRRRLTLAAFDLKDKNVRIIDIAVKYGYSSADSFTRAFHSMHGILPSYARNEDIKLKSYPRMTFQLSIKGGDEMNYRIIEKEDFQLIGFKKRVPIIFEGVNPEGFDVLEIKASTWAVFEAIGPFPETLQNVWGRIYSEWFPSSSYEAMEGPEILWNESPDTSNPKYRSEIWIPVKKRSLL